MKLPELYSYLVCARRDSWATLAQPDEVLAKPLLDGSHFKCIKDLVFHHRVTSPQLDLPFPLPTVPRDGGAA